MREQWKQLNYISPNIYGIEFTPEKNLHAELVGLRNYFHQRHNQGEISLVDPLVTSRNFVWQQVDYLPTRKDSHYDQFRGYVMVEPSDIPHAVKILDSVYQERKRDGDFGEFKWLMSKIPPVLFTNEWWDSVQNENLLGSYVELDDADPRIVLYENESNHIQEIYSALSNREDWREIEERRRSKFESEVPIIRGTNSYSDTNGETWYSLSYNEKAGHFKDQ